MLAQGIQLSISVKKKKNVLLIFLLKLILPFNTKFRLSNHVVKTKAHISSYNQCIHATILYIPKRQRPKYWYFRLR